MNIIEELRKLDDLFSFGFILEGEYNNRKNELINSSQIVHEKLEIIQKEENNNIVIQEEEEEEEEELTDNDSSSISSTNSSTSSTTISSPSFVITINNNENDVNQKENKIILVNNKIIKKKIKRKPLPLEFLNFFNEPHSLLDINENFQTDLIINDDNYCEEPSYFKNGNFKIEPLNIFIKLHKVDSLFDIKDKRSHHQGYHRIEK